jgi:hypothetical protein
MKYLYLPTNGNNQIFSVDSYQRCTHIHSTNEQFSNNFRKIRLYILYIILLYFYIFYIGYLL